VVADDAVLIFEASIIAGMRMLAGHAGLVVEPPAALGIAAVLEDRDPFACMPSPSCAPATLT
jgi:threonine dehydratase